MKTNNTRAGREWAEREADAAAMDAFEGARR